jgi:hypothetical protein
LELQWKELNAAIDQSLKDGKARLDQLHIYEKLRDQVLEWLSKNEARVDALEPVAVDADILKKQSDELKPIMKDYRDYEATIGRVADLGAAYENMARLDAPRKPSLVPGKRASISTSCKSFNIYYYLFHLGSETRIRGVSLVFVRCLNVQCLAVIVRRASQDARRPSQDLRRQSQDLRSQSPIKMGLGVAPLSPLINNAAVSSGYNSRRSSQDYYAMEGSFTSGENLLLVPG